MMKRLTQLLSGCRDIRSVARDRARSSPSQPTNKSQPGKVQADLFSRLPLISPFFLSLCSVPRAPSHLDLISLIGEGGGKKACEAFFGRSSVDCASISTCHVYARTILRQCSAPLKPRKKNLHQLVTGSTTSYWACSAC